MTPPVDLRSIFQDPGRGRRGYVIGHAIGLIFARALAWMFSRLRPDRQGPFTCLLRICEAARYSFLAPAAEVSR
jgi:hypothetical protein